MSFSKKVGLGRISSFTNVFFHERGRRGRSRHGNSAKITAAAFSRCDFLMVLRSVLDAILKVSWDI